MLANLEKVLEFQWMFPKFKKKLFANVKNVHEFRKCSWIFKRGSRISEKFWSSMTLRFCRHRGTNVCAFVLTVCISIVRARICIHNAMYRLAAIFWANWELLYLLSREKLCHVFAWWTYFALRCFEYPGIYTLSRSHIEHIWPSFAKIDPHRSY